MIKEIRDALIDTISMQAGLNTPCFPYRGEFEEGAEWNPVLPAVFVQCTDLEPKNFTAGGSSGVMEYGVSLYCGDKEDSTLLAESLFDYFDGVQLSAGDNRWFVTAVKAELIGYIKSVEIHKILLRIY